MVLLPLLSLCSRLFAKDDWPCPSKTLFSELDQQTECSTVDLLEAHRCSALMWAQDARAHQDHGSEHPPGYQSSGHVGHFDQNCPNLAKALRQRLYGITMRGENLEDVHLQELADYSAVVEALRSLAPAAVGVEEADMAVLAGRNLRAKLVEPSPMGLGSAVSLAQWNAWSQVPSSSAGRSCCKALLEKVQLLDASRLRRVTFAALQALTGATALVWIPLLRALLTELRRKIRLQPAEELLRLLMHFLKVVSFARRKQQKPRAPS